MNKTIVDTSVWVDYFRGTLKAVVHENLTASLLHNHSTNADLAPGTLNSILKQAGLREVKK